MKKYEFTVIYIDPEIQNLNSMNCYAINSDLAVEKLKEIVPDADVYWVNPGHNNRSLEEREIYDSF